MGHEGDADKEGAKESDRSGGAGRWCGSSSLDSLPGVAVGRGGGARAAPLRSLHSGRRSPRRASLPSRQPPARHGRTLADRVRELQLRPGGAQRADVQRVLVARPRARGGVRVCDPAARPRGGRSGAEAGGGERGALCRHQPRPCRGHCAPHQLLPGARTGGHLRAARQRHPHLPRIRSPACPRPGGVHGVCGDDRGGLHGVARDRQAHEPPRVQRAVRRRPPLPPALLPRQLAPHALPNRRQRRSRGQREQRREAARARGGGAARGRAHCDQLQPVLQNRQTPHPRLGWTLGARGVSSGGPHPVPLPPTGLTSSATRAREAGRERGEAPHGRQAPCCSASEPESPIRPAPRHQAAKRTHYNRRRPLGRSASASVACALSCLSRRCRHRLRCRAPLGHRTHRL
mmetsp:Transcript_32357/g.77280  ORF Transcript_32357/g.77280 Transcript_32357/m.77280 type:complete len:403 (-) Transcript_32357:1098-2306(-)